MPHLYRFHTSICSCVRATYAHAHLGDFGDGHPHIVFGVLAKSNLLQLGHSVSTLLQPAALSRLQSPLRYTQTRQKSMRTILEDIAQPRAHT